MGSGSSSLTQNQAMTQSLQNLQSGPCKEFAKCVRLASSFNNNHNN
jgi:hypothetical protein